MKVQALRRSVVGVLIVLIGSSVTAHAIAQSARVDRIDIAEAGIYAAEIAKTTPDKSDPTGRSRTFTGLKLVKSTNVVPARLKTQFGISYTLKGKPKSSPVQVRVVVRLPPVGLINPKTGETFHQYEFNTTAKIDETKGYYYLLEEDWEVIPGPWVFEVWSKNRKFAEQKFTLVMP